MIPSYASIGLGYGQTFQKLKLFYCQNRLKSIESIKKAPPSPGGACEGIFKSANVIKIF